MLDDQLARIPVRDMDGVPFGQFFYLKEKYPYRIPFITFFSHSQARHITTRFFFRNL